MKIKTTSKKLCQLSHEEIWTKYGKMIMKIAHKLSKRYEEPFDDLLAEGTLHVLKKLYKWNPKQSALGTFIYNYAYYGMMEYNIICKRRREIPTDIYDPEKETKPNWLKKFMGEISEESHTLIKILFESPEELYHTIRPTSPIRSKKALKDYMIDVMDWSSKDFNTAASEIRQCL